MRGRWTVVALLLGALAVAVPAAAAPAAPPVRVLQLHGAVDPFIASYLEGGIADANQAGDAAVLLEIDTPGGLDSSMRAIVTAIRGSRVPVLCWTGPSGARAASAGTFIMMACPVNAMAPGTEIGAAHPVGVAGAVERDKVTNDAAAFIASLARDTGRNEDWAKKAVTDSDSIPAEEAASMKPPVADHLAATPEAFLNDVDGTTTTTAAGEVTLHTAGATLQRQDPGIGVALLHGLIDPNLAFIFFYVGLILIVIELLHPGISVPGVAGTLLLVSSVVAFGILPVRLGGVALLAASVVLFLAELKHPGLGLPLVGGLLCLVVGGLLLFPSAPDVHVSRWLLALVTALLAGFFGFVVKAVLEARALPPPDDPLDALVGAEGVTLDGLAPRGAIRVGRERWSAELAGGGTLPAGAHVRVVGRHGLHLVVEPLSTMSLEERKGTVTQ